MKPGELYYKNKKVYDDDGTASKPKFQNLSEKHIDEVLNSEYNDYTPQMLHYLNSVHTNTATLSSKHIHKMLDTAKDFKENNIPSNIKNDTEGHLDYALEYMVHHKNLDHSHIDKIINNFNSPRAHISLVDNFPQKLTDEHLHTLLDRWKNYDLPWLNHAKSTVQNELERRMSDRKSTDNLYAGLQEYNK